MTDLKYVTPLYTYPQQPLTVDKIDELLKQSMYGGVFDFRVFARFIEYEHGIVYNDFERNSPVAWMSKE